MTRKAPYSIGSRIRYDGPEISRIGGTLVSGQIGTVVENREESLRIDDPTFLPNSVIEFDGICLFVSEEDKSRGNRLIELY